MLLSSKKYVVFHKILGVPWIPPLIPIESTQHRFDVKDVEIKEIAFSAEYPKDYTNADIAFKDGCISNFGMKLFEDLHIYETEGTTPRHKKINAILRYAVVGSIPNNGGNN